MRCGCLAWAGEVKSLHCRARCRRCQTLASKRKVNHCDQAQVKIVGRHARRRFHQPQFQSVGIVGLHRQCFELQRQSWFQVKQLLTKIVDLKLWSSCQVWAKRAFSEPCYNHPCQLSSTHFIQFELTALLDFLQLEPKNLCGGLRDRRESWPKVRQAAFWGARMVCLQEWLMTRKGCKKLTH